MDVRQLRYFVGVLEAKSLNKASGLLHVAQPALGAQIRNLERELGLKLLHRHPRGVEPTEAGERLARHARQLLMQIDRMRQELSDYAAVPSGRVLMCMARSLPREVSTSIAERCQTTLPDVKLRIIEGFRQQVSAEGSMADLALTFYPDDGVQFVWEPLVQDELVFVFSAEDKRTQGEIDFRNLAQHELILPSQPHYIRHFVEAAALLASHELRVSYEIDSFDVIKDLVARGIGKSIMPTACVRDDVRNGKLNLARIKNPRLQRTLYMVHSSRQARSSAVDLIRREVRSIIFECADDETFGWHRVRLAELPAEERALDRSGMSLRAR
jgi:LysR family nitrogen assimilation transcriptional regulator